MNSLALNNPLAALFDDLLLRWKKFLVALAGITTALATTFKVELLTGTHNFTAGQDAIKVALFKQTGLLVGTYDATTTNYSAMTGNGDEIPNGAGYTTGGVVVANTTPTSTGTVAYTTPAANAQWTASTFTTRGCMAYNSSKANRNVFVYDFGADEPVVSGTFTVTMPANDSTHALIRLA